MTSRQRTRIALIAGFCFLVVVGAGVYANRKYCAPRNSIMALFSAIDRRDREMVEEYVDAPALAASFQRCALESYKRETAKTSTNFIDRLFNPLGEELANGVVSVTYTPESVIEMLCGKDPKDAMKEGLANSSDKTVDTFTKDGDPKTKAYGAVGKALIRWAAGYAIDEAAAEAKTKQGEINPDDYEVAAQYETPNRYLITFTRRNSDDPIYGWVFKRHGLATWKFSEVRLIPKKQEKQSEATATR